MAWFDSDISVSIIDATFPLAVPSVSMPVILDINPGKTDLQDEFREYTSIDAVGQDHDTTAPAYKMANRILSQKPHVERLAIFNIQRTEYKFATVKVGDTSTDSGLIIKAADFGPVGDDLEFEAVDPGGGEDDTTVSVSATTYGHKLTVNLANDGAGTITATADEVRTAINESDAATEHFAVSLDPDNADPGTGSGTFQTVSMVSLDRSNTSDSPAELTRALNVMWQTIQENDREHPYFLLCPTRDYDDGDKVPGLDGDREELADAVSSRLMFYATGNRGTSKDDNNLESPSTMHTMAQNMSTDRALIFWHDQSEALFPEAAIVGLWGGISPGGLTLKWKRLNGIPAAKVNDNDIAVLRGQAPGSPGLFTYAKARGAPVMTGSWATDGSFADWRRDKDWLRLRIQSNILRALRNNPKLPLDPRGMSVVKGAINEELALATTRQVIAVDYDENGNLRPLYEIRMPDLKDIPTLERAARQLTGITILIHPAGAIEEVKLTVYATFQEFQSFTVVPGAV